MRRKPGPPSLDANGDRPAAPPVPRAVIDEQPIMSVLSVAVIESVEEAIYNSLLMARTVVGRNGNVRHGLPAGEVQRLVWGGQAL